MLKLSSQGPWALSSLLLVLASCAPQPLEERPSQEPERCQARLTHNSQLPARPYSQAVEAGGLVFFSGKTGANEETLALAEGRIEAETRNVMEGFRELFQQVGVGFEDVVQGTVFLADIEDYAGMNQVYGEYFPETPPARETVAVKDIVGGAAVEISFVAVCR
jgi:2-iminobutanoate/2-iminopropanoate deaminase